MYKYKKPEEQVPIKVKSQNQWHIFMRTEILQKGNTRQHTQYILISPNIEAGLDSLQEKKKDGKVIIGLTDKSSKYYAVPDDNFKNESLMKEYILYIRNA